MKSEKVIVPLDDPIILSMVEAMDDITIEKYYAALDEGYNNERCLKCGVLFLAHIHFIRCDEPNCPMKGTPSLFDMLFSEEE